MGSRRVKAMAFGRLGLPLCLLLAPLVAAEPLLVSPCTPLAPSAFADVSCGGIRPGAYMVSSGGAFCTLNFVVTDGIDLFIGTAAHCVSLGQRIHVAGHPEIGTVALDGARGDWAFIRIDPEDRPLVDPTLARWGGPTGIQAPRIAGDVVFHYGYGASAGQLEPTRGRAGVVLVAGPEASSFLYAGSVDSGDSGSPVMLATGEAAGIAVATLFVPEAHVPVPTTFASRFDLAVDELADTLGRPVEIVKGRALVQI